MREILAFALALATIVAGVFIVDHKSLMGSSAASVMKSQSETSI